MTTATTEKPFPPIPKTEPKYDERCTLRLWDGVKLLPSHPVTAFRFSPDGTRKAFGLRDVTAKPAPKSELTDADGNVYVVTATQGNYHVRVHVALKA